jgi:hypothetical protein
VAAFATIIRAIAKNGYFPKAFSASSRTEWSTLSPAFI